MNRNIDKDVTSNNSKKYDTNNIHNSITNNNNNRQLSRASRRKRQFSLTMITRIPVVKLNVHQGDSTMR